MSQVQVLFNGPDAGGATVSRTGYDADIVAIQGMTPDLTVVVQVRLDQAEEWHDYQTVDSTKPKALVEFDTPYALVQVKGLSAACRVTSQTED